MSFSENLKNLRDSKNLSQEELGKYIGVSGRVIGYYENGRFPKEHIIKKLADFFGVEINYLLGTSDNKNSNIAQLSALPSVINIPILGKISAGLPVLAVENIEGYAPIFKDMINLNNEYFYLRVSGDSMNLKMRDRDLVLVQRQDTAENGDITVVIVNGYDAVIKKFMRQDNIVQLMPMSTNPEHLPQIYDTNKTEVKIIGKAIYVTSML